MGVQNFAEGEQLSQGGALFSHGGTPTGSGYVVRRPKIVFLMQGLLSDNVQTDGGVCN